MLSKYEKAKQMQPETLLNTIANADYLGLFTEDGFVYRKETMKNGEKKTQFFRVSFDGKTIEEFASGEKLFSPEDYDINLSADGKFGVLLKDHNLWLKNTESGEEKQITFDGEIHYDYASRFEGDSGFVTRQRMGYPEKPVVKWSPDNSKFVTYKLDQRRVKELNLVQSVPQDGTLRPQLYTYKYAMPGDKELPLTELFIFDVNKEKLIPVDIPPVETQMFLPIDSIGNVVEWSCEGGTLAYCCFSRDYKKCTVYRIDPNTGEAKILFTEESDTFFFHDLMLGNGQVDAWVSGSILEKDCIMCPFQLSEKADTLLWYSNRDGWYQLYNYSLSDGTLKNQITKGAFEVTAVSRIDWANGIIYFKVGGLQNDPYDTDLCAAPLSGGEMKVITKGKGNHQVRVSPKCDCYIDFLTEADMEPVLTLHSMDNAQCTELLRCDTSCAPSPELIRPIRFSLPGADGKTPIFGVLYLPEEAKSGIVPIVEYYYGGIQSTNVPHSFREAVVAGFAEPLAQLGFAVVIIDGMGTPMRGKAFHDACYKNLCAIAGVEDHITVIRKLAEKYPLNIEKVGVFGHSGGGYATFHCLTDHGYFYKCGVASSGNHVQEIYLADWSERFMGEFDPEIWRKQNAEFNADKLIGQLLLIHGEMDDNVHPANTMRLVDALIKANKDFDLLIIPNYSHALSRLHYWRRRIMDFFVINLLNAEPPKN